MNRLLLLIATFLFTLACAKPYMSANDCADFCHAEGKKVAGYFVGTQIPTFAPRPKTKCLCETCATETP